MTRLEPHRAGVPLPRPTVVSKPYWEGCARGELIYQRCGDCRAAIFAPAATCRRCLAKRLTWELSAGLGRIYSWSTVWRPQSPAFATPYVAAIVDLDEGYQMLANVVGCTPEEVSVGLRVAVEFHPIGEGFVLPYFSPVA